MRIEGTWEELWAWALSLPRPRNKKPTHNVLPAGNLPLMMLAQPVFNAIQRDIAEHEPERAGFLIGPSDERKVTEFIFDDTGVGSAVSWTFGHRRINEILKSRVAQGYDLKGFAHSHPKGCTSLSDQDLRDFRKPFANAKNGDLTEILAPLVVDGHVYPYILYRDNPEPVLAQLVLC